MTSEKVVQVETEAALWAYRALMKKTDEGGALEEIRRRGRVERWGHAARVPLWMEADEVAVVIDGTVIAALMGAKEPVRLERGDVFGSAGRDAGTAREVWTDRETTISVLAGEELKEILVPTGIQRTVEVGAWRKKVPLDVPPWLLLGTVPTVRLARLLLYLVDTYGEVEGDRGRLPMSPSLAQMAELAGLKKKRFGQIWPLFLSSGLVEWSRQEVLLKDLKRLRQLAIG